MCADSYDNISHQYLLNLAILLLKEFSVKNIAQNADEDATSLLEFVIKQLLLIQVSKHGRRYSANMLTTAFLWQLTSTSLYNKNKQIVCFAIS